MVVILHPHLFPSYLILYHYIDELARKNGKIGGGNFAGNLTKMDERICFIFWMRKFCKPLAILRKLCYNTYLYDIVCFADPLRRKQAGSDINSV